MALVQLFSASPLLVSHGELQSYFLGYLTMYEHLVEKNMGLLNVGAIENSSNSGAHNLTFYWQRPYQVQGVRSSVHGAALIISPSNQQEMTFKDFSEPIEYYVWPSMAKNLSALQSIQIMKAETYYHFDTHLVGDGAAIYVDPGADIIYTGQGHSFSFPEGTGAILVFGSLMEDDRLFLKGSNSKEDWSLLQARLDSLSRFLWDCRDILNETALTNIDSEERLPLLLERISARIKDGSYKEKPSLFTEDYSKLKTVNAPDETLAMVLDDYYDMQSKISPTVAEQIGSFLIIYLWPIISTILAAVVSGIILFHYRQKAKTPEAKKPKRGHT